MDSAASWDWVVDPDEPGLVGILSPQGPEHSLMTGGIDEIHLGDLDLCTVCQAVELAGPTDPRSSSTERGVNKVGQVSLSADDGNRMAAGGIDPFLALEHEEQLQN
jgi:hypothetical protein